MKRSRNSLMLLLQLILAVPTVLAINVLNASDYTNTIEQLNLYSPEVKYISKSESSLDLDTLGVIQESIPIQIPVHYNDVLAYKFKPNLSPELTHSYQLLVYLSASLCSVPDSWNTSDPFNGMNLFYTFNETVAKSLLYDDMTLITFQNGFAEGLAQSYLQNDRTDYTLYIIIEPSECDNCDSDDVWNLEFAASQTQSLFVYDTEPRISVIDVDYNSILFEADHKIFASNRSYSLQIFEGEYPIPIGLNQSLCFIKANPNAKYSLRLDQSNSTSFSNVFVISDLTIAEQYSAVLVVDFTDIVYGGGVFQPFSFTMSKSKSCKLVYGLSFCNEVAYSVPISSNLLYDKETWGDFVSQYDNYSESYYQPFQYAMQQIACDTELDARYSPIRTCDDCMYSYKQWLCAVTIPRCVSSLNAGPFNKVYKAGTGRNKFIEDTINPPLPYAEVLPCYNVCEAIVRDCPADFSFGCPEDPELAKLSYSDPSYNILETDEIDMITELEEDGDIYRLCNYMGENNMGLPV